MVAPVPERAPAASIPVPSAVIEEEPDPVVDIFMPPFMKKPLNQEALESGWALITWGRVVGAENYQLQLSRTQGFESIFMEQRLHQNYHVFEPDVSGRFYWRVRSLNSQRQSPWSDVRSFSVP
jgi:hypothetical protein